MSAQGPLPKTLTSGTFKPQPSKTPDAPRVGHQYLLGMLTAGNIRLEMHETIQQPGAEHEAVGTHKHNEIWCVQRGTATLWINGVEHTMEAGDVGLVCAGDQHWIGNKGPGELAYFVITVGPPEYLTAAIETYQMLRVVRVSDMMTKTMTCQFPAPFAVLRFFSFVALPVLLAGAQDDACAGGEAAEVSAEVPCTGFG